MSEKVTVPVGFAPVTVAMKVMFCPTGEGLNDEVSVVVLGTRPAKVARACAPAPPSDWPSVVTATKVGVSADEPPGAASSAVTMCVEVQVKLAGWLIFDVWGQLTLSFEPLLLFAVIVSEVRSVDVEKSNEKVRVWPAAV